MAAHWAVSQCRSFILWQILLRIILNCDKETSTNFHWKLHFCLKNVFTSSQRSLWNLMFQKPQLIRTMVCCDVMAMLRGNTFCYISVNSFCSCFHFLNTIIVFWYWSCLFPSPSPHESQSTLYKASETGGNLVSCLTNCMIQTIQFSPINLFFKAAESLMCSEWASDW